MNPFVVLLTVLSFSATAFADCSDSLRPFFQGVEGARVKNEIMKFHEELLEAERTSSAFAVRMEQRQFPDETQIGIQYFDSGIEKARFFQRSKQVEIDKLRDLAGQLQKKIGFWQSLFPSLFPGNKTLRELKETDVLLDKLDRELDQIGYRIESLESSKEKLTRRWDAHARLELSSLKHREMLISTKMDEILANFLKARHEPVANLVGLSAAARKVREQVANAEHSVEKELYEHDKSARLGTQPVRSIPISSKARSRIRQSVNQIRGLIDPLKKSAELAHGLDASIRLSDEVFNGVLGFCREAEADLSNLHERLKQNDAAIDLGSVLQSLKHTGDELNSASRVIEKELGEIFCVARNICITEP